MSWTCLTHPPAAGDDWYPLAYLREAYSRRVSSVLFQNSEKHLPPNLLLLLSVTKPTTPNHHPSVAMLQNMEPKALVVAVLVIIITWYLVGRTKQLQTGPSPESIRKAVIFSDRATCALVLACEDYTDAKANNSYTAVKSRAIPNKRLIKAFEIDNSFTTSDGARRKEFNQEAGKAIKLTEAKVSTPESEVLSSPAELVCAHQEHRDVLFHSFPLDTSSLAIS